MNNRSLKAPSLTVWITRTAPGADRTAEAVRAAGFETVVSPLLAANPAFAPAEIAPLLEGVTALAFTSVNGLAFADLTLRRDWPVFAVGDRTAEAARERGFTDVRSAGGDARDLAALIRREWPALPQGAQAGRLLVPTATRPAADLAAMLEGQVQVRAVAVYETLESPASPPGDFDIVLIHSPRAAEALARRLTPAQASGRVLVALSQACAEPLHPLGFDEIRVAAHPDEASLLQALGKPPTAV